MAVAVPVGELDLDLDAFEGPFDLLLTLVLRDELPLCDVDLVEIVLAFVERRARRPIDPADPEAADLDLDACGEFLILISALLDLKARGLFPDEELELGELEPEEAAEELAQRLARYRQAKEAAQWLSDRLAEERDRWFRLGPAPLAPEAPEPVLARHDPARLAKALRLLAVEPPAPSTAHMALRFPPVAQFVERWRSLLRRRALLDFDQEVKGLSRVETAVAFLALLELCKQREVALSQASSFAPIRISRPDTERSGVERPDDERKEPWTAHSA